MREIGQLRPIRDEELGLMLSWRNSPKVRSNMYTQHEISMEEHLAWWARTRGRDDADYAMYECAGQPMGIVGFTAIDRHNATAAWAFYASPTAPPGTGSKMEYLALDKAFSTLKLHKLHCEVLAFNTAVIALHQRFGFAIEGKFREQYLIDGRYVDVIRLGMLASEWQSNRPPLTARICGQRSPE